MRVRERNGRISDKRLLDAAELAEYTGLGRNTARKFAEEAGALRRYGKRVLFDRIALDKAIDQMGVDENMEVG